MDDFNDDGEDHSAHGDDCIHKQLMSASYDDLLQAYTNATTAAESLERMFELPSIEVPLADAALSAMETVDWIGDILFIELRRRGSTIVRASEN